MENGDAFDLSDLKSTETDELAIVHPLTGAPTTWVWTLAGPGHPKSIESANIAARDALRLTRLREQAVVNRRKWVEPDRTPDRHEKGERGKLRHPRAWLDPDQTERGRLSLHARECRGSVTRSVVRESLLTTSGVFQFRRKFYKTLGDDLTDFAECEFRLNAVDKQRGFLAGNSGRFAEPFAARGEAGRDPRPSCGCRNSRCP